MKFISWLRKLWKRFKSGKNSDWRTDMSEVQPVKGAIAFYTRNVQAAIDPNLDGGMEYIISRINGSGFRRVLIMVMGGASRSTRIYVEYGAGDSAFQDALFPAPMVAESAWRIDVRGSCIVVSLNGGEIWRARPGAYHITSATMNGYTNRGFNGEWKL